MQEAFDYKNTKEEIWNAITHGVAFLLCIPALVLLIMKAMDRGSTLYVVSFIVFGASMLILFLASTLLHSMPEKNKRFFAILDHSSIYILIAGTYTPFLLIALKGALGWALFGVIWALALLGILFKCFFIHRFEFVSVIFYILMGWLIIIAIKPLYTHITGAGFSLLLSGGILYTIGAFFYACRKIPYNHAIWHLFVIAGSAMMFFCVLFYV
ncbi:hemolysin III family protein [Viridibacillus sp. YIM B01967]|uniref:Hemolysin III family protein n=1 Tax=Viridibacillus soli TaxID=2798301 RepID=A0ABS1H6S2_9BACL|nr:hemolysin III family protein [Viridibacillus soli]MBK3495116.1 hemolysin III family protein [Viridibacillus soli]